MDLLTELAILVLAAFVGFEVISKVPNTLHTPLMSGTNAIHGIVVLGGLLLIGPADGFLEERAAGDRDRLRHDQRRSAASWSPTGCSACSRARSPTRGRGRRGDQAAAVSRDDFINLLYIVAFVAVHRSGCACCAARARRCAATRSPRSAWRSRWSRRCCKPGVGDWGLIVVGVAIGTAVGIPSARSVKMTAMPQMVALFNGVGGGAVALISFVEFRECRRRTSSSRR